MLADWYFCSSLRLTIHQTKTYLDVVQILRSPFSGGHEIQVALENLAQQEEAVRLHALRHVLACFRTVGEDPPPASSATSAAPAVWDGLLNQEIEQPRSGDERAAENALRRTLDDLLTECLFPLSADFAARVVRALADLPQPDRPESEQLPAPPYHDLHEQGVLTVALVLLDRAAQEQPGVVAAAWRNEKRLTAVRAALRGESGRWPLLLAASALTRLQDAQAGSVARGALTVAGHGAAHLEPDLLAVLARSWFGHPDPDKVPPLDPMEAEIARGGLYQAWQGSASRTAKGTAVRDRLGVVGKSSDTSLGIVLWQLTLWELAAEHDPLETAARTAKWWAPTVGTRFPHPGQPGISVPWARLFAKDDERAQWWLTRAASVHWNPGPKKLPARPQRVAAPGEPARDPSTSCSPWLERRDDTFRLLTRLTAQEGIANTRFPGAGHPLLLIQLIAVSLISVDLLRAVGAKGGAQAQQVRHHLIGMLFHASDVFHDPRFLTFLAELREGAVVPAGLPPYVAPSTAALLWHARTSVDRAGKGGFPEIGPQLLVDFLIDGPGAVDPSSSTSVHGPQWRRLFVRPAWHVARLWAKESASGVRRTGSDRSVQAGWYDGDNPSARRMLATAAERLTELDLHQYPKRKPTSPHPFNAALSQEFDGAIVRRPDWMSQLHQPLPNGKPRTLIGYEELLGARPYPLVQWKRNVTRITELTTEGPATAAMLTIRLAAILDQTTPGAADDEPEWVEEWLATMAAVNSPGRLARPIRAAAIDLFGPRDSAHAASTDAQDRLRRVLEVVVDAIIEFSAGAPRYYQLLMERVAGTSGRLSPETMNRLRARTVDAVRRRHDPDRVLPTFGGPWAEIGVRKALQDIEAELRILVQSLAGTPLAWNCGRTLGMIVTDGWRDARVTPAVSKVVTRSTALSAWTVQEAPDPRLVVARALDHFRGEDQFLVLPHRLGPATGPGTVDLLTKSGIDRTELLRRWQAEPQAHWVVGTVCATYVQEDGETADDVVHVNWGVPQPLVARTGGARRWRTGDLCRLEVCWNPLTTRWEQAAPLLDDLPTPAPVDGEVRAAWSTPAAPDEDVPVHLVVEGETQPAAVAGAGSAPSAWLRWAPDLSARWSARSDTLRTLARWDAAQQSWLPADRTLTELIADDLPYSGDGGCRANVLIFTGSVVLPEAGMSIGRHFVTPAGHSYLLYETDWVTPTAKLDRALEHGAGTLVYAGLRSGARLELLADPPEGAAERWPSLARGSGCDLRNAAWLKLFSDAEGVGWEAELVNGRWTVDVAGVPGYPHDTGFPPRVTVRGLESATGTRCAFHPEPWDQTVVGAGTATVSGEVLAGDPFSDHEDPTWQRFQSCWEVTRNTVLPLDRFRGGRQIRGATVDAVVKDGITVRVDRSSLPFGRPPSPYGGLPWVEITKVTEWAEDPAEPTARLSDDDFAARLAETGAASPRPGPGTDSDILPDDRTVRGVVAGILRRDGHTSERYQVWLDLGGRIVPAVLPASSFGRPIRAHGETFTANRSEVDGGAWAFHPRGRTVFAQALHVCQEAEQPPHGDWSYLGTARTRAYYARPEGGPVVSVAATGREARPVGHDARVIADLGSGRPLHNIPRRRLLVGDRGTETVGDAAGDVRTNAVVTDVELGAWHHANGLVALHRRLTVRARSALPAVSPSARKPEEEWRERLDNGEPVTLSGTLPGNNTLLTSGVRLPLAADDAPHVIGNDYGGDAEALLLKAADGTLYASTRDTPPRDAAQFVAAVTGAPEGMPIPSRPLTRDVYYVGAQPHEDGITHRFEWGNGLTAVLEPGRFTVNGRFHGPERAFPLHHGDRLGALSARLDDAGTIVVDIRSEDVEIQVGHQVYIEATKGVVHQLVLDVDPRTRSVVVRNVRLRDRTDGAGRADQSRKYPVVAELDDVSRDRILAAVAAAPRTAQDLAHLEVLARLDQAAYLEDDRRRIFVYVEAKLSTVRAGGVVKGEHVFMVAGTARSTGNDAHIEFRLPGNPLPPSDAGRPLTVRVRRRQFSAREYLLAQLVAEGREDYFKDDAVMLVRLRRDRRTNRWFGDLTTPPERDGATLTGAVREAGGRLLVTLTKARGKVEVRPGVVYDLPQTQGPSSARKAGQGALVVVSAVPGGLRLDVAQPADRSYAPEDEDRPALLLPKDDLFGLRPDTRAEKGGDFTVVGLPGLSVTADPDHTRALLRTPHPRVALLRRNNGDVTISPPVGVPVRLARVLTEGDRPEARVVLHEGSPRRQNGEPALTSFALPWELLSFKDADADTLRRDAATTTWTYHDAFTRHMEADGSVSAPPLDLSGRTLSEEPVFFDEEAGVWTLRYRPHRLALYGMPATVLTEQPRDQDRLYHPSVHVVAGPSTNFRGEARGLWLELSPGRVVQVDGRLLMGPGRQSLGRLDWSLFGPGDQVHLEVVRGEFTAPRRLRLVTWRPGPRSALLPAATEEKGGTGRTVLEVRRVDGQHGGLALGGGDYTLTYPVGPDAGRYRRGDAVVLQRSNHLSPYDSRSPLAPGDTALIGWSGGRLRLHGLPGASVRPADREPLHWPGAAWLHDALTGPAPEKALRALGGALPVTVEESDEDGTVVVSRRLQPTSALSRNGLLRTEAVAALGPALVVRSGAALHRLSVRDVIPGIPAEHAQEAARAFARSRRLLWLRVRALPGRRQQVDVRLDVPAPRPYADEYDAVPFAVVGPDAAPVGLLVHTPHDHGHRWLPIALLSWADALSTADLSCAFPLGKCSLRVRQQTDGSVSAAGVRRVYRARRDLKLGTKLRVEPLDSSGAADGHLAVAQPHGMVVRLTEIPAHRTVGEAIPVEVDALGPHDTTGVRVVPSGRRPLTLDLPENLACGTPTDAAARLADLAESQRQGLFEGWADAAGPWMEGQPIESIDAAVLQAWPHTVRGTALGAGHDPSHTAPGIAGALRVWLDVYGSDAFSLRQESELGLAPALAACLLMAHLGNADPLPARGAVLLAHQIGLRAGRSLHVEPLTRLWISPDGTDTDRTGSPLDVRLAALRLPPVVDQAGLKEILRFGHGVLGRVDTDAPTQRLHAAARAVLVAVGQLSADMDLRSDAELLSQVADLGRALHPPRDEATAQAALTEPQRNLLGAILTRSVREGPLELLPVPTRLAHQAAKLAEEVLHHFSGVTQR